MLKITLVDTPGEQRIVLFGTLAGPWIKELHSLWEDSRQDLGNRRCVIDLNEVTLIDQAAHQLLATMLNEGAEFVATGVVNRWLIEALKREKTQVSIKALHHTRSG
jgi:ABC-type transporter Mla MlaB component